MAAAATVDEYIAGFPPEVAERLQRVREVILANVPEPEEKVRYAIAAVMLGGRYALHYAGWKKHIGVYPVPALDEPLESEIRPYRAEKDSVVFPHDRPVPYELIGAVTRAIVARRAAAQSGSD
ncbi:DUF1801 domain-containing protein [uncultured Microbacterium sp.]|uniref:iron chaperone n=1 Tax=uncultured Microbacterium sp. TaxID=191216 RepID=UPI0028D1CA1A|nr:DUF1801 domain-containing protein [uncultured Microbacterium sp.]